MGFTCKSFPIPPPTAFGTQGYTCPGCPAHAVMSQLPGGQQETLTGSPASQAQPKPPGRSRQAAILCHQHRRPSAKLMELVPAFSSPVSPHVPRGAAASTSWGWQ